MVAVAVAVAVAVVGVGWVAEPGTMGGSESAEGTARGTQRHRSCRPTSTTHTGTQPQCKEGTGSVGGDMSAGEGEGAISLCM